MRIKDFYPNYQFLATQMPHLKEIFRGVRNRFYLDQQTKEIYREANYAELSVFYRYTIAQENGSWLLITAESNSITGARPHYHVSPAGNSREEARDILIEKLCKQWRDEHKIARIDWKGSTDLERALRDNIP